MKYLVSVNLPVEDYEGEMMPTIGTTELIIILVIVLIVFGVGRLPQVSRDIGKGLREFRESINQLKKENHQPTEANNSGQKKS